MNRSIARVAVVLCCVTAAWSAPTESADSMFKRALAYFDEQTWDRAATLFERFLATYPTDPREAEAGYRAISARQAYERSGVAARWADYCRTHTTGLWAAKARLAWCRSRAYTGELPWPRAKELLDEALAAYRAGIAERTMSPAERDVYAELLLQASRAASWWPSGRRTARADAESYLRALLDLRPRRGLAAAAWFSLAEQLRGLKGREAEAEQCLLRVVREYADTPSAPEALARLAGEARADGRTALARARYKELMRRYPGHHFARRAARFVAEIEAPVAYLSASQTHLPGTKVPVRITARNQNSVKLTLYSHDLIGALAEARPTDRPSERDWRRHLRALKSWEVNVRAAQPYDTTQKTIELDPPAKGVYVLALGADTKRPQWRSFTITSLVLTTCSSAGDAVCYVADRATGLPAEGVAVSAYRERERQPPAVVKRTTNADGLCRFAATDVERDNTPLFFQVIAQRDREVVTTAAVAMFRPEAGQGRLAGQIVTDRPLYRPGDTVRFRAVLRRRQHGQLKSLAGHKIRVQAELGSDSEAKLLLTADRFGAVVGEFKLPSGGRLGVGGLEAWPVPDREQEDETPDEMLSTVFQIEEYRKPEFQVVVGQPAAPPRPGGGAAVPVTVTYYHGGPVANAEVRYQVTRSELPPPFERERWWARVPRYRHHWPRAGDAGVRVAQGTGRTDAVGKLMVEFACVDDAHDWQYQVTVTVADPSRRQMAASTTVAVAHQGFALDAQANAAVFEPNREVTVTVKAATAEHRPVATSVSAMLYTLDPAPARTPAAEEDEASDDDSADHAWVRGRAVWAQPQTARTDGPNGQAAITFPAPGNGYYELVVTAPDTVDPKTTVSTTTRFWSADQAWKGVNQNTTDLRLTADKFSYQAGDTAHLLINAPVDQGALWLVVGGDEILDTQVVRFSSRVFRLDLPIKATYTPNVFLEALVVGPKEVYQAAEELRVSAEDRRVKVKVTADRNTYRPRAQGGLTVETTDAQGRPVSALVSLAVTDQALYDLADDHPQALFDALYAERRDDELQLECSLEHQGVYGGHALDAGREKGRYGVPGAPTPAGPGKPGGPGEPGRPGDAMPGVPMEPKAVPKAAKAAGGTFAAEPPPLVVREFFPDSLLWQPLLITGTDGKATVPLTFADSATTWRADAWAVTEDSRAGDTATTMVTSQDLLVRLHTPRFLTQLDSSACTVVVTNKTDRQQQVAIELDLQGVLLQGERTGSLVVPARGEARLDRLVQAVDPGRATLQVTARGADDGDAVRQHLDVVPHGATRFDSRVGRLDQAGATEFTLDLPATHRPGTASLTVNVAPSLVASLLDGLPYLLHYPYGCTEQTTSQLLAAVRVARVLRYVQPTTAPLTAYPQPPAPRRSGRIPPPPGMAPERVSPARPATVPPAWQARKIDELPTIVAASLLKLRAAQNRDGGFGWFPGMESDAWMTAYALQGLVEAADVDYDEARGPAWAAVRYLTAHLGDLQHSGDLAALAAWVLAEAAAHRLAPPAGKPLAELLERVYARRGKLGNGARALLAMAMKRHGRDEPAQVLWRNLQTFRIETSDGAHWNQHRWSSRWCDDQVTATALALHAGLAVEPSNPLLTKAARWLQLNRTGNQWANTLETATAIAALARYADLQQELRSTYQLALTVNGKPVKSWSVGPANALTLDGVVRIDPALLVAGDNRIRLERQGAGPVWYSGWLEYATNEEPIRGASAHLGAQRTYYRVTPTKDPQTGRASEKLAPLADGETLPSGEVIEVVLKIAADNTFSHVCVADAKPAGCEAEDRTSGGTWGETWLYRELRDREVTFFCQRLPQGELTVRYRLRAETPGVFHALPVRAFSMYRDDVRALSDEAQVRVGERAAPPPG